MQQETIPFETFIQAATLAPSGHNTQPWKFQIEGTNVRIRPDFNRRLPIVDPNNRALFISLGCAVENLIIAAEAQGYRCHPTYELNTQKSASILVKITPDSNRYEQRLYSLIPRRRTNRKLYNGKPIPSEHIRILSDVFLDDAIGVQIITDGSIRNFVQDLIIRGEKSQFTDQNFKNELLRWIRFNKRERLKFHDGLSAESTGNPSVPRWLGSLFLKMTSAEKQASKDIKLLNTSSALAIFWSQDDSLRSWILCGRYFERWALIATQLGIQHAHMNQAVENPETRLRLKAHPIMAGKWPQLILRLGYAPEAPASDRRDLKEVVTIH